MDGEGLVGRARKRLIANPTISKEKKIGAPDWCGAVMFTDKFIKLIRMTRTNQWTNFFQIGLDLSELSLKVFIHLKSEQSHSFRYIYRFLEL